MNNGAGVATTDGSGYVLLPVSSTFARDGNDYDDVLVTSDGRQQVYVDGGLGWFPFGQFSGFEGTQRGPPTSVLNVVDESGRVASTVGDVWIDGQANNPMGGIAVIVSVAGGLEVRAYDAELHLKWRQPLPPRDVWAVGVDRQGMTLVLSDGAALWGTSNGNGIAAQWFDSSGNPGPVFNAGSVTYGMSIIEQSLFEQVGSGLFLLEGAAHWTKAFPSGEAHWEPVPSWLQSRQGTTLHMAFGGRAYALWPNVMHSLTPCEQVMEIVAPDGTSCGTQTFFVSDSTCDWASISVGYDGTVIEQIPQELDPCPPDGPSCTLKWQWWPHIFG